MIQVYGNLTSRYDLTFDHFEITIDVYGKMFNCIADICRHCENCRIILSGQNSRRMGFLNISTCVLYLVIHMLLGSMQ